LIHVCQKLLIAGVQPLIHFILHSSEVHWLGDLLEVVRNIVNNGVDWLLERTN
jgi:hypothetical protein